MLITNILLIIVIVLMVLGLFLQVLQLQATISLPEDILDFFLDLGQHNTDVPSINLEEKLNTQGFGNSERKSSLKWIRQDKNRKKSSSNKKSESSVDFAN